MSSNRNRRLLTAPDGCTQYLAPEAYAPIPLRLVGVWAHPDDEAYLSAGLMARTVAAGGEVTLIALTDGEDGFSQDDPRSAAQRAAHRRYELQAAMAAIGVDDVRFLGLADGKVDQLDDAREAEVVSQIADILCEQRPDTVVTFGPDGVTGHPDHIATWRLTTQAWSMQPIGELWYAAKTHEWLDQWRDVHDEWGVWMTEEPTGVDADDIAVVVDLEHAELDRKRAVLAAHASQTDALAVAFSEPAYRRWVSQEAFRRPNTEDLVAARIREVAGKAA